MPPSTLNAAILNELVQPKIHIRLPWIMTPVKELVTTKASDRTSEAISRASEGSFDQLPVVGVDGHITGLVYIDQLQRSSNKATVSDHAIPLGECGQLRIKDGISKAVSILRVQPASLVTDGEKVVGLVHRSDLNKHPARTYFYLWLSALEIGLARLVELRLPGDTWIESLRDQAQIWVLGKMKFESLRNNSISPIEYLDLSNVVEIIEKNEFLYCELGFNSRSEVKSELGGLVDLRHDIMHPVRTLVSDAASMNTLANREKRLRAVRLRVQRILKKT